MATAHARPPPARLLTRMRSVPASGLQGMGPTTLHSPASRRGRMSELPNFEPLGFSSRSCRSTGRLMRSLAPWWGEADLRLPPFFPEKTRRVAAASAGFSGRGQDRSYVTGATPSSSAPTTKPSWTQTCNEYLLSVTKLTHCTIACKSFAPARACGGRYAWFCKIAQGLCGNDLRHRPLRSDCTAGAPGSPKGVRAPSGYDSSGFCHDGLRNRIHHPNGIRPPDRPQT